MYIVTVPHCQASQNGIWGTGGQILEGLLPPRGPKSPKKSYLIHQKSSVNSALSHEQDMAGKPRTPSFHPAFFQYLLNFSTRNT